MSNRVKNYFRVLEVISSLNIDFNVTFRVGRKAKIADIEAVNISLTRKQKICFVVNDIYKGTFKL
jgi:hypothetical protein